MTNQVIYKNLLNLCMLIDKNTFKNVFILGLYNNSKQTTKMSESNSHSRGVDEQDDYQPELSNIPQNVSYEERTVENLNSYMRISGRDEKIDEEGILQEFHKRRKEQQRNRNQRKLVNINKKIKPQKVSQAPSKKYDFGYIKKKWKAQIDLNLEKYKQYLKLQKSGYDFKEKEFMLDFFKILLDGYFELKDYALSQFNDLTNNERKIIAQESDYFLWLQNIVNNFDKEFKQAKFNQKIQNAALKWKSLIKNCMDENNFQLRRKIIRSKVKPIDVIENNDTFLMSEQAKLEEERQKKRILAEADKNFQKPIQQQEDYKEQSYEQEQMIDFPEQLESLRSISYNQNLQKKINQEKQKLQEYKQFIVDQTRIINERIQQVLKGTPSYDSIIQDFTQTFESH